MTNLFLPIDDKHIDRLGEILGVSKRFEWHTPEELAQAIDMTYARMFPSEQDLQVEEEYRDHESDRRV